MQWNERDAKLSLKTFNQRKILYVPAIISKSKPCTFHFYIKRNQHRILPKYQNINKTYSLLKTYPQIGKQESSEGKTNHLKLQR